MSNFSFHTFSLTYKLSSFQEFNVRTDLYALSKVKNIAVRPHNIKRDGKRTLITTVFNVFSKIGINIILSSFYEGEYALRNTLYCRVNPRLLLRESETPYVGIFKIEELWTMLIKLISTLKSISIAMPPIEEATLNRLDYCINIDLRYERCAELYVSLLKQCNIPHRFEAKMFWNEKAKKLAKPQNSICISCKSFDFNIYYKYAQMIQQNFKYPDIDDAIGLIRFEIQAKYGKLYSINNQKGVKDLYSFLNKSPDDGMKIMKKYARIMFCRGQYVRYSIASEKIESSGYLPNAKENMKKLLRETSRHKSLFEAVNELKRSGLEEYQIKGIIEKFDKLNINPVTIPNDCSTDKMPNPIDLIEDKKYFIWIADPNYKSRLNRAT